MVTGLALTLGIMSAAPTAAQAATPKCSAERTSTSADGKTIRSVWSLCIQQNHVILKAACTDWSLAQYWQTTSCSAQGAYTLAKNGEVLHRYRGRCMYADPRTGMVRFKTCPAGKETGKLFNASGSDGQIDRDLWFSCDDSGTYTVTLKAVAFSRKNLENQSAYAKDVSVSAPLC